MPPKRTLHTREGIDIVAQRVRIRGEARAGAVERGDQLGFAGVVSHA
jgi:hypothetical protein